MSLAVNEVEQFDLAVMELRGMKTYDAWRRLDRQVRRGEKAYMFTSGLAGFTIDQTDPIHHYPSEYEGMNLTDEEMAEGMLDYINDIGCR